MIGLEWNSLAKLRQAKTSPLVSLITIPILILWFLTHATTSQLALTIEFSSSFHLMVSLLILVELCWLEARATWNASSSSLAAYTTLIGEYNFFIKNKIIHPEQDVLHSNSHPFYLSLL